MTAVRAVMAAELRDLLRNKWLIAYSAGFLLLAELLFWFGGSNAQVTLSLLNITLLIVPLVSLVFGTIHTYASREFVEVLLAQPVSRMRLFAGLYLGLAIPLAAAFCAGTAIPLVIHGAAQTSPGASVAFLFTGVAMSFTFAAVAAWIALRTDDRLKGIGVALAVWIGATFLYDGLVLTVASSLSAWPLERPMLAMMLGNPIDLARVTVLMYIDAPALMGYTGALFNNAFGTAAGLALAIVALLLWCAAPIALAARRFRLRDF